MAIQFTRSWFVKGESVRGGDGYHSRGGCGKRLEFRRLPAYFSWAELPAYIALKGCILSMRNLCIDHLNDYDPYF